MATFNFLLYLLAVLTCLACTVLLFRGYAASGLQLLLWSALCFVGRSLSNVLLFFDLVLWLWTHHRRDRRQERSEAFGAHPAAREITEACEQDERRADQPPAHLRGVLERPVDLGAKDGPREHRRHEGKRGAGEEMHYRNAQRAGDHVLHRERRRRHHVRGEHRHDAVLAQPLGRRLDPVAREAPHAAALEEPACIVGH